MMRGIEQVDSKYERCWAEWDTFDSHFGDSAVSGYNEF